MAQNAMCGGLTPQDPNSPLITEVAAWAVQEYNKEHGTCLVFKKALEAATQVVCGVKYYIGLEAVDGCLIHKYNAIVLEKKWMNYRKLESFQPLVQENDRIPVAN